MEELSSQDLTIVAAVVFLALVAFIAVLYLNRKSSGKAGGARTPNVKASIPEGETGTVFVEGDGGKVVRRSTRQHKPATPLVRGRGSLLIVEFCCCWPDCCAGSPTRQLHRNWASQQRDVRRWPPTAGLDQWPVVEACPPAAAVSDRLTLSCRARSWLLQQMLMQRPPSVLSGPPGPPAARPPLAQSR